MTYRQRRAVIYLIAGCVLILWGAAARGSEPAALILTLSGFVLILRA